MEKDESADKSTLTNETNRGLFIPMSNAVTPDEMERMAEQLEETARALRLSADALRGTVSLRSIEGSPRVSTPSYVNSPPTVLTVAARVLKQAGKPLHVTELLQRVHAGGAFVKDQYILSSMLSKDKQQTFRPSPGRRGFWELIKS